METHRHEFQVILCTFIDIQSNWLLLNQIREIDILATYCITRFKKKIYLTFNLRETILNSGSVKS